MNGAEAINRETMIPALLRAAPSARPVLDRYGLRGCGGEFGPVESLAFFSKAHDVPLPTLLSELRAAVAGPELPIADTAPKAGWADTIYRPFFIAGIAVVLTLGAAWGAALLIRIAFAGTFSAAGLHEVNAHGHAQIFGWVGLFVMGFAYQAFPRFRHTSLSRPRMAWLSLWLMLAGILGRSIGEPLADHLAWAGSFAIGAAALEVLTIGLFIWITVETLWSSAKPLAAYELYILSSMAWFVIQAIFETAYLTATLHAANREELIRLVRTWQGALRDTQIHGFALLMILGVSQRIFPYFYGLPAPNRRTSLLALPILNLAVAGEAAGLILMASNHAWAALWYASVLTLTTTVTVLVVSWKIHRHSDESDRSLKFLRTAYVWLFVSLALLVLIPVYQFGVLPRFAPQSDAAQIGFSHAYYGAIRHAITVGFLSLMIVGVAAKIVPTLNGVDVRTLSSLWWPFCLINAGCTLRVAGQVATDFWAGAFPLTGISGVLEVLGHALWGIHLCRIMLGRPRLRALEPAPTCSSREPGDPIIGADRVGEVLARTPQLLDTFLDFGFKPLTNPLRRRTLAAHVTIDQACRMMDVDADHLLAALNEARTTASPQRIAIPLAR
jgi:hypothetical protein